MTKRTPITESPATSAGGEPARLEHGGRASRGPGARSRAAGSNPENPMTKLVTVDFHDDTLFAVDRPEGVLVALKPISDRLGLDWTAQLRRTKRDPVLAEGMVIMAIPSLGGAQETAVLPLHLLPGWLFGIGANQVKPDARPAVLLYQRECHEALFRHFMGRPVDERGPHYTDTLPGRAEPMRFRRQLVADAYKIFGIRAAGRLWFELGLPVVAEMREPPRQSEFGFTYTAVRQDPPAHPQGGK